MWSHHGVCLFPSDLWTSFLNLPVALLINAKYLLPVLFKSLLPPGYNPLVSGLPFHPFTPNMQPQSPAITPLDSRPDSPLLDRKWSPRVMVRRMERSHAKLPLIRKIPFRAIAIILFIAFLNAIVWIAAAVVLVCLHYRSSLWSLLTYPEILSVSWMSLSPAIS